MQLYMTFYNYALLKNLFSQPQQQLATTPRINEPQEPIEAGMQHEQKEPQLHQETP
jgi:hypothetical protein